MEYYIIVINCSTSAIKPKDKELNLLSIASRSLLEITLSEIFKNDIDQFLFVNRILKGLNKSEIEVDGKKYKAFKIKVIQPKNPLVTPWIPQRKRC